MCVPSCSALGHGTSSHSDASNRDTLALYPTPQRIDANWSLYWRVMLDNISTAPRYKVHERLSSKMVSTTSCPAFDAEALTSTVRKALGLPSLRIDDWRCTSLTGHISNPATGGLYRVIESGRNNALQVPWSIILKIVHLAEDAPQGWGTDLLHFGYWKREALAYQSGFLANLGPHLRTPRCFEVAEQPDGSLWLWLEEVRESGESPWPISRYGLAARHFGQWQGTYLAGR